MFRVKNQQADEFADGRVRKRHAIRIVLRTEFRDEQSIRNENNLHHLSRRPI